MDKEMICFEYADGWHYCYRSDSGRYIDICTVKHGGKIVWKMEQKNIDDESMKNIFKTSEEEKESLHKLKEEYSKCKKDIKKIKENTLEWYNMKHKINWLYDKIYTIENLSK